MTVASKSVTGSSSAASPLARALVVLPSSEASILGELEALVAEELNVKEIERATGVGELVSYTVKPNFKALGPRFGPRVKSVAQAISASDAKEMVDALESEGTVHIDVEGEQVSLTRDDLEVRVEGREGFSLAQDGPYGVALDLEISPELLAEGVAREVVRAVQELRKSSGLAVEDRITLWLHSADAELDSALRAHSEFIASEVLATDTQWATPAEDLARDTVVVEGASVAIGVAKAG